MTAFVINTSVKCILIKTKHLFSLSHINTKKIKHHITTTFMQHQRTLRQIGMIFLHIYAKSHTENTIFIHKSQADGQEQHSTERFHVGLPQQEPICVFIKTALRKWFNSVYRNYRCPLYFRAPYMPKNMVDITFIWLVQPLDPFEMKTCI